MKTPPLTLPPMKLRKPIANPIAKGASPVCVGKGRERE